MAPTGQQVAAVERLVRESVSTVDALGGEALRSVLPALRAARDELRADLFGWLQSAPDAADRFTAYHMRQALRSLEATFERIEQLSPALARGLERGREMTGPLAVENLDTEIRRLSAIFGGGVPTIPQISTAAILARGESLLWRRHERSAARYAGAVGDDIKHLLAVGVARNETFEQLVRRLRGLGGQYALRHPQDSGADATTIADGLFRRHKHWADRLVRTELMHGYNVQHDAAIDYANENRPDGDDEYLRRWDASADKRVCSRCRALHATVATIDGTFRDGVRSPPLHPYCRCIVLAWLARWGDMRGETPIRGSIPKEHAHRPRKPPTSKRPPRPPKEGTARHIAIDVADENFHRARQSIEVMLGRQGMAAKPTTTPSAVTEVTQLPVGVGGYRHWKDGRIQLDHKTASGASEFAREWLKDPKASRDALLAYGRRRRAFDKDQVQSVDLTDPKVALGERLRSKAWHFSTTIHESLHGYGPTVAREYVRHGVKVEEVTTEVMARRIMRDEFGVDMRAVVSKSRVRGKGAYEGEIQETVAGIRKATGLGHEGAYRALERASLEYKRLPEGVTGTPSERLAELIANATPPKDPDLLRPARYAPRTDGKIPSRHESIIEAELSRAWSNAP